MIALQVNLKDITKRPMRLTAYSETKFSDWFSNLKLIGEELWRCHDVVITVYDCQWNELREIMLGRRVRSVASLDTKTVVIATDRGLVILSTSGMSVRVVNVCIFCRLYLEEEILT